MNPVSAQKQIQLLQDESGSYHTYGWSGQTKLTELVRLLEVSVRIGGSVQRRQAPHTQPGIYDLKTSGKNDSTLDRLMVPVDKGFIPVTVVGGFFLVTANSVDLLLYST